MWILTTPTDQIKALLLYVQPDKEKFKRGIVTYEGSRGFEDIDIGELIENYAKEENLSTDSVSYVFCRCTYKQTTSQGTKTKHLATWNIYLYTSPRHFCRAVRINIAS